MFICILERRAHARRRNAFIDLYYVSENDVINGQHWRNQKRKQATGSTTPFKKVKPEHARSKKPKEEPTVCAKKQCCQEF